MTEIVRERMARFLYGLFIWAMEASKPKRSPRAGPDYCDEHIGIACVLCSSHTNVRGGKILHSCMIKSCKSWRPLRSVSSFSWLSSLSTSSSWSFSTDGDLLGTESGVQMSGPEDAMPWEDTIPYISRKSTRKTQEKKRDIPPPITILRGRGEGGVFTRPIPWGLHREYKDGRLILREASAESFQYLESIREDGSLIMNLVSVDNSASFSDTIVVESGKEGEEKDARNPIEPIVEARESEDRKGKQQLMELDEIEEMEEE